MSESKPTESAPAEDVKTQTEPTESTGTQAQTTESENNKPPPIDAEKSKEVPPESSAAVTAKPEAVETKTKAKPVVDLSQYASSVDPKAPKPSGPSDTKVSTSAADESLAEKTDKLAIGEQAAVPSTDSTGDAKSINVSPEFKKLAERLVPILEEVKHEEMWGVTLVWPAETHVPTQIVLQKFLNANANDPVKAAEQFKAALQWRKEKQPLQLLQQRFNANKFDDLGLVTDYPPASKDGVKEVFTWNVYGSAQGRMDQVFGDLEEFMSWRIALQELGLQCLSLSTATNPIPSPSPASAVITDPYKITQVHDYKSITFFSQPASVKAASKEVIKQFGLVYPELLKEKFFVNVPAVMGWLYAAVKLVVAKETAKKFHPMADGTNLAKEYVGKGEGELAEKLPKEYGGKGDDGEKKAWRLWSSGSSVAEGGETV